MDKTFCILIFFPYLSFLFLRSVDLLSPISSFSSSSLHLFYFPFVDHLISSSPFSFPVVQSSISSTFVSSQVVFSPVVSTRARLFSWGRLLFGHLSPMVQGVVAVQSPRWWKSSLLSTPLQSYAVWQSSRIVRCFSGRQSSYV